MAVQNFDWNQGEDLNVTVTYQIDDVPVDLTGWEARMDISAPTGGDRVASLHTFNTEDSDPLTDDEITMGADGVISIHVSRGLSLGAGVIAGALETASSVTYNYDLFIRSPEDQQKKILEGNITVKRSVTLWE